MFTFIPFRRKFRLILRLEKSSHILFPLLNLHRSESRLMTMLSLFPVSLSARIVLTVSFAEVIHKLTYSQKNNHDKICVKIEDMRIIFLENHSWFSFLYSKIRYFPNENTRESECQYQIENWLPVNNQISLMISFVRDNSINKLG